jgi:hypothetical protein
MGRISTRAVVAASLAISLLGTSGVNAASIGLFSTPDCSDCSLDQPPGGSAIVYVNLCPKPDLPVSANNPLSAAAFRITGLPSGWVALGTPNPAASLSIGDPFGTGVDIVFRELQTGECINLYRVMLTNPSTADEVVLRVVAKELPDHPAFPCPNVSLDCPCFPFCVGGGQMFINSSRECTVSVESSTWSALKGLYKP